MTIRLFVFLAASAGLCLAGTGIIPTAAPEPGSLLLVGAGIVGGVIIAKRRHSRRK